MKKSEKAVCVYRLTWRDAPMSKSLGMYLQTDISFPLLCLRYLFGGALAAEHEVASEDSIKR
jgi:hypothetical protein